MAERYREPKFAPTKQTELVLRDEEPIRLGVMERPPAERATLTASWFTVGFALTMR